MFFSSCWASVRINFACSPASCYPEHSTILLVYALSDCCCLVLAFLTASCLAQIKGLGSRAEWPSHAA
jgi:hypothetical protein